MTDHDQWALTISEVAVDWQEPMVLLCKYDNPLPARNKGHWTHGSS